jgi:hypothetical protein
MQPQEYSTESSLPIALASPNPVSNQSLKPQKTFFTPHRATREDELMRYQHREKMLRNHIERVRKHPAKKEYRKELQKREETLRKRRHSCKSSTARRTDRKDYRQKSNDLSQSSLRQEVSRSLPKRLWRPPGDCKSVQRAALWMRGAGLVLRRRHEQGYRTVWKQTML